MGRKCLFVGIGILAIGFACAPVRGQDQDHTFFGIAALGTTDQLDHNPWRIYPPTNRTMMDDARSRGIEVWRLYVMWPIYEPESGQYNSYADERIPQGYIQFLKDQLDALLARGFKVIVNFQLWDPAPPEWLWRIPHSRYKNQYGEEFKVETIGDFASTGGQDFPNVVFNPEVRAEMARFIGRFFEDFKEYKGKIWAIDTSLGGGGDALFPYAREWKGRTNCYWAFDARAQDRVNPGSLAGPMPVPGWTPGTKDDPTHEKARKFLNWYLESANRTVQWQIETFRRHYAGRIMLYSDLFFKDIDLEPHIQVDLDGSSEDPTSHYFSPAVGPTDGRYLKTLISRFPDVHFVIHHSGLELLEAQEIAFVKRYASTIGGENAFVIKEQLGPRDSLRSILDDLIDKVKRYRLAEFMWMFSDGLYVENLKDPMYDVSPAYYGSKIREVNGPPAVISHVKTKRVSGTQAEVTWTTDVPTDSRVVWCEDAQMRKNPKAVYDGRRTTEHKMTLTGLKEGKLYYFEVGSDNGKNYALSEVRRLP